MAWSSYPKVVEETASWCSKLVFQDIPHRFGTKIYLVGGLEPWLMMVI